MIDHAAARRALVGRLRRTGIRDPAVLAAVEQVPRHAFVPAELEEFAHRHGHPDFHAWVGTENYEMRVAPDLSWIDEKVLAVVRGRAA